MSKRKEFVLNPDSELEQPEFTEAASVAVMEPPKSMASSLAGMAVTASVTLTELDAAWDRDLDGTATIEDFATINRVHRGEEYDEERLRRQCVRTHQHQAGSWKQLAELEAAATAVETETSLEIAKLQNELDETARRIQAEQSRLSLKAAEAQNAVKSMQRANEALRDLAPKYVHQHANMLHRRVTDKLGPQISDLINQIGPREVVVANQLDGTILSRITPHSVPHELHEIRRVLTAIGYHFGDRWNDMVQALPGLRKQFAAELPEMKEKLEQLQQERLNGIASAKTVLDCYLPA